MGTSLCVCCLSYSPMKRELDADEINAISLLQNNFRLPTKRTSSSGSLLAVVQPAAFHSRNDILITEKVIRKIRTVCPLALKALVDKPMMILAERLYHSQLIEYEALCSTIEILLSTQQSIDKKIRNSLEVVLKATWVYFRFLQLQSEGKSCIDSADEMLSAYSKYTAFQLLASDDSHKDNDSDDDRHEISYLVLFRTMMKSALRVIPAKRNKMLIIAICAMLEGSGRSYVTGGTQSSATSRRMIIFEQESGIQRVYRVCHGIKMMSATTSSSSPSPSPSPSAAVDPVDAIPGPTITCCCGATILKRSLWKHVQSTMHKKLASSPAISSDYFVVRYFMN